MCNFLLYSFNILRQKTQEYYGKSITNGHLLFVIGALILSRVQKCKVRQVTKDVVKSEVLRIRPQTISPYVQNCDSLCTRTDHYMLLPIVLHMVVPLYLK